MDKKCILLICFVSAFISIKSENCDKLGILLYEDLGCRPKNAQGNSCPTHYDCDDFVRSNETCLFRAQQISVGENVDDSLIYANCRVGCLCRLNENENITYFNCAILDCPEWLGDGLDESDCYRTYTLGKCCSTGHKCAPFDKVTKCVVDGKEYKEGQTFGPAGTCLTCVCQEGFNGKFVEPFCQRSTCSVQIASADKLAQNCAPVYFGDDTLCCPSQWACASSSDQIKQIGSKSTTNSSLTCKWGKHILKMGQGLDTKVGNSHHMKDVACECILPPLLTCKEKKNE